ncbi:MAG: class II aldolase/adducin family protein [Peptococcaceae bacterium]|nr:class II aldolase/adducin family protein [Peptococcaceae bacterium]
MVQSGLVMGAWGNLSCRIAGENSIVITPSGIGYDRLSSNDMVKVDMDGKCLEGRWKPSSELKMHLAIYRSRPGVHAVVHTHSPYASALAVAREEIPPILEELVLSVGGGVKVAGYAPAGSVELADAVVTALQEGNAALLANHGVVGLGTTPEEAFVVCQTVEKAAQVYVLARQIGKPAILSEQEVLELRESCARNYGQKQEMIE